MISTPASARRPLVIAVTISAAALWIAPTVLLAADTKRSDSWIIVGALAATLQAVSVTGALWFARGQLDAFRSAAREERRAALLDRAAGMILEELPGIATEAAAALFQLEGLLEREPEDLTTAPKAFFDRLAEYEARSIAAAVELHTLTVRVRWVMALLGAADGIALLVSLDAAINEYLRPLRQSPLADRINDVKILREGVRLARQQATNTIEALIVEASSERRLD